jgi:hypothetical protein
MGLLGTFILLAGVLVFYCYLRPTMQIVANKIYFLKLLPYQPFLSKCYQAANPDKIINICSGGIHHSEFADESGVP